ncbi:MAG: protease inhibitor I42 family protein [Sphingosinicella sp.]|uniref:protease inhibitor I42 family protein n=1 Tax=Sphingosinicella sp. TaxID=1917971 RepID=UPI004037B063
MFQSEEAYSPTPHLFVTEAHNGTIVALRPSEAFEVRLPGNSTISPPVQWTVAATPQYLRLSHRDIVSDAPGAAGAGATWIFRFTAVAEGRDRRLVFDGGDPQRRLSYEVEAAHDLVID